jgi:hypothetical protein
MTARAAEIAQVRAATALWCGHFGDQLHASGAANALL